MSAPMTVEEAQKAYDRACAAEDKAWAAHRRAIENWNSVTDKAKEAWRALQEARKTAGE